MEENFGKSYTEKRLESRLYKALFQHSKMINKPFKMGKDLNRHFSKKICTHGQ